MKRLFYLLIALVVLVIGYFTYRHVKDEMTDYGHKVVLCIPVYGQSLALGEEAVRVTNFDSLRIKYDGRIVAENLDYGFGYNDDWAPKRIFKQLIHYDKRAFELSVYKMAEDMAMELGEDTIICIFPEGRGMSNISIINKSTDTYNRFLEEISHAYQIAQKRGWEFKVPAICWMQGESDIQDYPNHDYKALLKQFNIDINQDIKSITHQQEDIPLICYQPNIVTRAKQFNANDFTCIEMRTSQAIVDLIREDSLFWASGPTYPCHFVNDKLHIDAKGQQYIGSLQAIAVQNILKGGEKTYGVIPLHLYPKGNDVLVHFNVPQPPLVFDTVSVSPIDHQGFSVITKDGRNILSRVSIEGDTVRLSCKMSPVNCKVRYAVNGEKQKSGYEHGPRGNLRDSHPLRHWCYQFDMRCPDE